MDNEVQVLRLELKLWEKSFAGLHEGKKAGREDIKQHPEIAAKYKIYNKLRARELDGVGNSTASAKRHASTKPSSTVLTPQKRAKHLQSPPGEVAEARNIPLSAQHSPVAHRKSIGPTPQKNGHVLGLFDLLTPSPSSSTPSKRPSLLPIPLNLVSTSIGIESTKGDDQPNSLASPCRKRTRSPSNTPKTTRLASFITPSKRRITDAGETPTAAKSVSVLRYDDTPAFLRRDAHEVSQNQRLSESCDHNEDDVFSWSPVVARVMRPKPAGRGLSALMKGLRDMEEAKLDDELDLLNEMEEQEGHSPKGKARIVPKVCVEDSQVPDMPLGPDGEGESGREDLEALDTAGKDRSGRPLKIWKKKGQKRTTRRVTMKPNTAKWKPEQEWSGGKDDESEEEVVAVGETQIGTPALDVPGGSAEDIQTDHDWMDEGIPDPGVQQGEIPAKVLKHTEGSKSPGTEAPKDGKLPGIIAVTSLWLATQALTEAPWGGGKLCGSDWLCTIIGVLHMAIPIFERSIRTSKPSRQLMQEKLSVLPTEEFLEHVLRLTFTAFDIYGFEDSNDVLEQELRVVGPAYDTLFFWAVDVKESRQQHPLGDPVAGLHSFADLDVKTNRSRHCQLQSDLSRGGALLKPAYEAQEVKISVPAWLAQCLLRDGLQADNAGRRSLIRGVGLHDSIRQKLGVDMVFLIHTLATPFQMNGNTTSANAMAGRKLASYTITGLKRWSCLTRELPPVSQVKALHVYDFDNTLFMSPLPSPKLWANQTTGLLQTQECFVHGGWWHDPHILLATGEGIEKEEPRAWEGWWNEQIVDLVDLSIKQNDALTILLTGRGEDNFAQLIKRIVASKKLAFDMICLKPQAGPNNQTFTSTMNYKQAILQDLVYTYKDADEIRIYEDRVKHTRAFREHFERFNKILLNPSAAAVRNPITAEVIQVTETNTTLDPVSETAEIQRMINGHNTAIASGNHALSSPLEIKRTVFFTGYLISPIDTNRLLTLVKLPSGMRASEVKTLANNILITPRPCPDSLLGKIGGIGRKQTWQVTGITNCESRIWAARVTPVPANATYHTDNPIPIVVLALVKGARPGDANRIQNWQPIPPDKQYIFQTEIGEKVQLRIEPVADGEGDYQSRSHSRNPKRRRDHQEGPDSYRPVKGAHHNDENRRLNGANGGYRGGNQNRGRGGNNHVQSGNHNRNARGGRGHAHRGGNNNNNNGNGNRGRGGKGSYKSLDDVHTNSRYANHASSYQPNYDDVGPGQNSSKNNMDGYNASFPAIGGGGAMYNSGAQRGGDVGLPYGK
ncbi:MAG: hypothetical protein Q9169_000662 [Polycauliona sp. 2 TL-2023]